MDIDIPNSRHVITWHRSIEHHHYIQPLFPLCPTRNHVLPTVFNLPKNHRPHYYHSSLYSNNQLRKKHNRSVLAFFFCQLCVCIGGQVCYLNYYSTASCTSTTFLYTAITQSTINGLKLCEHMFFQKSTVIVYFM